MDTPQSSASLEPRDCAVHVLSYNEQLITQNEAWALCSWDSIHIWPRLTQNSEEVRIEGLESVLEEGKTDVQGHSVGLLPGPSLLHGQKPEFHTSLTFAAHLWDGELGTWVNDQLESKSPLPPGHTSLGVRRPGFMSQLGHFLIARLVT